MVTVKAPKLIIPPEGCRNSTRNDAWNTVATVNRELQIIVLQLKHWFINMSDSSYAAVTRHRRPLSTSGRPRSLDLVDDAWASETLSDDEIDVNRQENEVLAPLLEEEGGELDMDTIVVPSSSQNHHYATSSASGNGGSGVILGAVERRRKEEGK